jgi:Fe2+ or Zn2+ uptake regulation protein
MRSPDELTDLFRTSGRKVTAQRQCIFRLLEGNESHPTAEAVYEAARVEMETISLKTVYQTLNELAELGEIAALDLGTGTVRFDPNVERAHHHLVCRSCGKVRDLNVAFAGLSVPAHEVQGYDVDGAEVVFRGLCGECRRRRSARRPRGTGDRARHPGGPRSIRQRAHEKER